SGSGSVGSPPPPPVPSTDPALLETKPLDGEVISPRLIPHDDVFKIPPLTALKLLGAEMEALVNATGDIPPTPPPRSPTMPNMRGMQAEKESIVRSHSERSLQRLRELAMSADAAEARAATPDANPDKTTTEDPCLPVPQPIDGVRLRASTPRPPRSPRPELHLETTKEPYIIIGDNSQPLNLQHSAITRKFYSKAPPPISILDYLLRIHRFCPMSTAVYLAASLYIHRLAVQERAIAVTKRNAHRLLLAGLRVAMKALEDLSYPHSKFAKVGGVSETELARLEISFCFLAGFELMVDAAALGSQWEMLRQGSKGW
ncbi:cyclin-domain-containing protein, partial [Thozetella sp. PMI_491]